MGNAGSSAERGDRQIIASLAAGPEKAAIALSVDVPEGLVIDGYPAPMADPDQSLPQRGKYAFPDGRSGTISISARPRAATTLKIIFADNGGRDDAGRARAGVRPFFTTRPARGRTGLGLHNCL